MAHYATLRDHEFAAEVDDLRGAVVYGRNDEKLGTIDDIVFDHETGNIHYAVIDTGGWLKSGKFLVPAGRIEPYHKNKDDFYADLDREQIQMFPPYEAKKLEQREDWDRWEQEYKRAWHDGVVQHIHGSDRNITPDIPAAAGGERRVITGADLTPDRLTDKFTSTEPSGRKLTLEPKESRRVEDASWGTEPLSGRWGSFEQHIQRNIGDIRGKCPECGRRVA